jgi:ABC-type sugar transport system substrate-binding protein
MTRILVCGGRAYANRQRVFEVLASLAPSVVIEGGARGADAFAGEWADLNQVQHIQVPADWDGAGKVAGYARNQRMLDEGKPDLVVAFPGSTGTRDMIRRAQAAGVRVLIVDAKPRRPASAGGREVVG